jgi:hypothetical protein
MPFNDKLLRKTVMIIMMISVRVCTIEVIQMTLERKVRSI